MVKKSRMLICVFILLFSLNGCAMALHYRNNKGIDAKAKDVKTKAGKIDKGNVNFKSSMDFWLWLPWKMDIPDK